MYNQYEDMISEWFRECTNNEEIALLYGELETIIKALLHEYIKNIGEV